MFPSILIGIAQTWFKSLKPNIISSFSRLSSTFSNHFVSNRRHERTIRELLFIKQCEIESLQDFIGRFNVEAVSIPRPHQDVVVLTLMTGLREGSVFRSFMDRKTFTSLGPILEKAYDFIRGEEFNKVASSQHREPERRKEEKKKKDKGRENDTGREERKQESNVTNKGNDRGRGERKENFDAYT